ncbi:(Fe-S)-binding protein [Planosporangium mesophilum]|uniref:Glycolate oxidase iron-sulfur subunit n=1 Tax=Planosporangium mesophilum TaxID=689768 RepID=A0A8J3TF95_9ACTN|nr:heterodisulfide reductase-related iron-sulfur binding cluster [Planosporangium mesophilum]NJC86591.1 4Fe-4S dicluster domain-containing protein [Planosporangium mesophilum]GII25378.1 glycolate oxidase iron-sulfur subunit [Planosporangium mesophilum]
MADDSVSGGAVSGGAVSTPTGTRATEPPRDVLGLVGSTPGEGAFDHHHPPKLDLVNDCVHCGFCLTTCPTYVLWGEEMDSPRGRIYQMKQGLEGEPLTDSMVEHFDRCLGCMACVTACPSGVQYDKLIEDTRQQVERRHSRSPRDRALRGAIFKLFPYPKRLRLLRGPLRAYQASGVQRLVAKTGLLKLMPTLGAMESLAPRLSKPERLAERVPAQGAKRAVVGMLTGCVQSAFFPDVNAATARILTAEGCEVVIPRTQGCCGALSVHNGREEEAQKFARALIDTFSDVGMDYFVVNAAGCGSSLKEYDRLLADDPAYAERATAFTAKVRDLSEILVELGPVAPRHPLPVTVAYHDACHLGHAQGVRAQPRALLRGIPGLELREIADAEICCGSAGIWNVLNPEPAQQLGERKARDVLATGAALLVTANPGCLMQVAASVRRLGADIGLAHTAHVLDASIRGLPVEDLL